MPPRVLRITPLVLVTPPGIEKSPARRGGVIVLIALLAACTTASPSATGHLVEGSLMLNDAGGFAREALDSCAGDGGYTDIKEGGTVTVTDQDGTIIATGSLNSGSLANAGTSCRFDFTVPSVPDAEFYQIEVTHRGPISYSRTELEANGWRVSLRLGD